MIVGAQFLVGNYKSIYNCIIDSLMSVALWGVSFLVHLKMKYHIEEDTAVNVKTDLEASNSCFLLFLKRHKENIIEGHGIPLNIEHTNKCLTINLTDD